MPTITNEQVVALVIILTVVDLVLYVIQQSVLQRRIERLAVDVASVTGSVDALDRDLDSALEEVAEDIADVREGLRDATDEARELAGVVAEDVSALAECVDELHTRSDELGGELHSFIEWAANDVEGMCDSITELQDRVETVEANVDEGMRVVSENADAANEALDRITALEDRADELRTRIEGSDEELDEDGSEAPCGLACDIAAIGDVADYASKMAHQVNTCLTQNAAAFNQLDGTVADLIKRVALMEQTRETPKRIASYVSRGYGANPAWDVVA